MNSPASIRPPASIKQIDARQLQAMRQAGGPLTVVDVREAWEWDLCRIEPSKHIPLGQLSQCWESLPTNHPIVIVCHRGMRSAEAVAWLNRQGRMNVLNLSGGLDAWAHDVDPMMRRY